MKKLSQFIIVFLLSINSLAQQAEVVTFRHDLRWVDESKFPNYLLVNEVHDAIFKTVEQEVSNYLKLSTLKMPEEVSYKIINGFGKQKLTMPEANPANDYEVGIFSFITRTTVGFGVLWKFNIVIKKKDRIVFQKEVVHELEYYNVSGYLTSVRWLDADKFQTLFIRMLKETLGVLPPSDEVIVIGSLEELEAKAQQLSPQSTKHLLKVDGDWKNAGNFVAQLESPADTVLNFRFKDKLSWDFPTPSLSGIVAQLFTEMTNIETEYEDRVKQHKKASLIFSDGEELGILLKWIQIETYSTRSDEAVDVRIEDPLVAELYAQDRQIGYFVYVQQEFVNTTEKTKETFNAFAGYQFQNTLGIELVHRIEGSLYNKPFLVEYNENTGIIIVLSADEVLAVMVIDNINPDNRSISDTKLSKNKKFVIGGNMKKASLQKVETQEWFPVFLQNGHNSETDKIVIQSLIYLFFGMGNM